jgi:hypothetical protein
LAWLACAASCWAPAVGGVFSFIGMVYPSFFAGVTAGCNTLRFSWLISLMNQKTDTAQPKKRFCVAVGSKTGAAPWRPASLGHHKAILPSCGASSAPLLREFLGQALRALAWTAAASALPSPDIRSPPACLAHSPFWQPPRAPCLLDAWPHENRRLPLARDRGLSHPR